MHQFGKTHEPIAITGISAHYPNAQSLEDLEMLLDNGLAPKPELAGPIWRDKYGQRNPDTWSVNQNQFRSCFLTEQNRRMSDFGIPPILQKSFSSMQKVLLLAVEMALDDAGFNHSNISREKTNVYSATCLGFDKTFFHSIRTSIPKMVSDVVAEMYPEQGSLLEFDPTELTKSLIDHLRKEFKGFSHDRLGQMASTIPAQIAIAFGLKGATIAIESADTSSLTGIHAACCALWSGSCEYAIVTSGQKFANPLLHLLLAQKGILSDGENQGGSILSEGAGAVVLSSLSNAIKQDQKIYGLIRSIDFTFSPKKGPFHYKNPEIFSSFIDETFNRQNLQSESIGYVESSFESREVSLYDESKFLSAKFPNSQSGSIKDTLGHTFATSGLASLTKVALSLFRKKMWFSENNAPKSEPWREIKNHSPRRASILASGLTGSFWHLVIEEFHEETPRVYKPFIQGKRPSQPNETIPVAIVAADGTFSQCKDADEFWTHLHARSELFKPILEDSTLESIYVKTEFQDSLSSYINMGAKISQEPEKPFGLIMTPLQWKSLDITQKLALKVAKNIVLKSIKNKKGMTIIASNLSLQSEIFQLKNIGMQKLLSSITNYWEHGLGQKMGISKPYALLNKMQESADDAINSLNPMSFDGMLASGIAAHINHAYQLNSVPLAVEAACASSLSAISSGIDALRSGQCDYVIAGGVELPCNIQDMILCSSLGILSKNAITPFDSDADGFTLGDGIGLFTLKRLEDAKSSGDKILGIIKGIGSSNDACSLVAPQKEGQINAMNRAFHQVNFDPSSVQYLETHGTGTLAGDQTESESIEAIYGQRKVENPLYIGAVKANIGHTFAAAGSAGLLKVLKAMEAKTIPPMARFKRLNPKLTFERFPAIIPGQSIPWHTSGVPRRAAVSSFGTGGVNYHLLIEEP